jgi:hypothetical protein
MKFSKEEFSFITEVFHEPHRGGDLDFVILKNGSVLIVSEEGIGHYSSFDSWVEGEANLSFIETNFGEPR